MSRLRDAYDALGQIRDITHSVVTHDITAEEAIVEIRAVLEDDGEKDDEDDEDEEEQV